MKSQGVNYDVGTHLVGYLNREVSLEKMQEEIEMIEKDLHANSIRIYGMEKDKLHDASKIALDKGMEVWYSPRHINLSPDQTLKQIAQYAKDAETIMKEAEKVLHKQNLNNYDKKIIKEKLKVKLKKELEEKDFLGDKKFDIMDEEIEKAIQKFNLF